MLSYWIPGVPLVAGLSPDWCRAFFIIGVTKKDASQSWVDWLAFQGEYAEGAFVDFSQGLALNESFQAFDAEGEFAEGEGAFVAEAALAEAGQILGGVVVGAVDDAEVFWGRGILLLVGAILFRFGR